MSEIYHWWSPTRGFLNIFFFILKFNFFSIYEIASSIEQLENLPPPMLNKDSFTGLL